MLVAALVRECFWGVVFIAGYLPLDPELEALEACLSQAALAPDPPVGDDGLPARPWPREESSWGEAMNVSRSALDLVSSYGDLEDGSLPYAR